METQETQTSASLPGEAQASPAPKQARKTRRSPAKKEAKHRTPNRRSPVQSEKQVIETPNLRARELPQAFNDWGGIQLPNQKKRGKEAKSEQGEGFGMGVGQRCWEAMSGER